MKLWRKALGILFIIIGLAGFILPILPGWLFFFSGLSLLGLGSTELAQNIKKKAGLEEVESPHEDIDRIPSLYRTSIFIAVLFAQAGLMLANAYHTKFIGDHEFILGISVHQALFYIFPTLALLLGIGGLFASIYWQPEDIDDDYKMWETYFTLEVIALPIFWALLLYLF